MAVTITWVKARQIFISRDNPTVEVRHFCFTESSRGRKFGFASFFFLFRSKAQPS
jgi:enolase